MIRSTTAAGSGYTVLDNSLNTRIVFGNGTSTSTSSSTVIGSMPALVVSRGLTEDLVSANPLVDSGHTIALRKGGGVIQNDLTGRLAPIIREGPR